MGKRFTNFPNGITSLGIPTFGTGMLPPFTGNYFFVKENSAVGIGVSAGQGTAQEPFNTLQQAINACVSGNNDVIFLEGTVHVSATVAWNKDFMHLAGLNAPSISPRARISQTGATLFTPLVNVTGQGCIFTNFGTFHGFATASAQICWAEAGQRNAYSGVLFGGMGHATAAAQAGSRSLTVGAAGQGENIFSNCVIGLDTIVRSAANASLEFLAGSPRNKFENCIFPADTSSAAALFVNIGASGIDRWQDFDKCAFINTIKSASTQMTVAFAMNAASGGLIAMRRSSLIGATKWGDTGGLAQIYVDGGPPTAATSGIGINPS